MTVRWALPEVPHRVVDRTQVEKEVRRLRAAIKHLMHRGSGANVWESLSEPSILVARELSPGLTVQLDRDLIVGLISEEGTRTSHAAILAHSIGIPAIFGLRGAVARIKSGTKVILDGTRGTVLVDPTPEEVADAQRTDTRRRELATRLEEAVAQPSVTLDGVRFTLRGNVDLPDEVAPAQAHR